MSPYSLSRTGRTSLHQGGVCDCDHGRRITRGGVAYWLGATQIRQWFDWLHDDDRTPCPEGPGEGRGHADRP